MTDESAERKGSVVVTLLADGRNDANQPEQINQKFMEMLPSALPRKPRQEESRGNRCRGLKNSGRTSSARLPPHPFVA
jgi:hypothetical protein